MKICLVAPVSSWRGGIHQYSVHLANNLAERASIEVVGYRSIFPMWLYPGESKCIAGEIPIRDGIRVHPILAYYSPLSAVRAAGVIARDIRPDVVDIQWIAPQHSLVLLPLMCLVRKTARIFLTVHNILPHEPRVLDRTLTRWAFRMAHRLVVHADALKDGIVAGFGEDPRKIEVIPHGICANAATTCSRAEARRQLGITEQLVVLFFGFVRPYKGLQYLIRALAPLASRFDVALVIAGEFFTPVDECRAELAKNGITDRTYLFPRYVTYEEIPVFFRAADVVVQPYVRFAGQSGVTQTAYLYSVPVIATEVGGLPELVKHGQTGLLVRPGSVRDLTDALEAVLSDAGARREYGAGGQRFLKTHLAWDRITERLLEIYAESRRVPTTASRGRRPH